jgi:HSP20 family protein
VSRLQKEVDRLFGAPLTTAADSGAWLPPVDIHEETNQFVLHVDLPGVDPKAVEITSDQGVLSIRGQREDARKESREGFRRIERISGEFQRRFSLPESADAQNIKEGRQWCAGSRYPQAGPSATAQDHGRSRLGACRRLQGIRPTRPSV